MANDLQFGRLARVLEMADLIEDVRFCSNDCRVRNRAQLIPIIEKALVRKTSKEWLSLFDEAQIPAGPINTVEEVFSDPQVSARDMLLEFESDGHATIRVAGNPIKYSRTPIEYGKAPPLLGADTNQLLSEVLLKSPDQIRDLRSAGVI